MKFGVFVQVHQLVDLSTDVHQCEVSKSPEHTGPLKRRNLGVIRASFIILIVSRANNLWANKV